MVLFGIGLITKIMNVRYSRRYMEGQQIAELRARLDTIERLLAQLSAELKGIRETLHAAAPAVSKDRET